jgi:hypothetical protein
MRRFPALLLLAVLLGGLGASTVHRAQHGVEWADAQRTHAQDHHETGSRDHASTPCVGGDLHALDCAVCSGLSGAVVARASPVGAATPMDRPVVADEVAADARLVASTSRGPPAAA